MLLELIVIHMGLLNSTFVLHFLICWFASAKVGLHLYVLLYVTLFVYLGYMPIRGGIYKLDIHCLLVEANGKGLKYLNIPTYVRNSISSTIFSKV